MQGQEDEVHSCAEASGGGLDGYEPHEDIDEDTGFKDDTFLTAKFERQRLVSLLRWLPSLFCSNLVMRNVSSTNLVSPSMASWGSNRPTCYGWA